MKTKVFLTVLFTALLTVTTVSAKSGISESKSAHAEVRKEVLKAVDRLFIEGNVSVSFTIDSNNKIRVANISGSDAKLVKEVSKKLEGYSVSSDASVAGKYSLSLRFVDAGSSEARLLASY